jgi:CheY-like chemotaxis protein
MTDQSTTILGILTDLFFRVKIEDAAKRSGLVAVFATTEEAALEHVRKERPLVAVVDLNCAAIDPIRLVAELRTAVVRLCLLSDSSRTSRPSEGCEAQNAGYDAVLARSAFSSNLPQLLRRYSESSQSTPDPRTVCFPGKSFPLFVGCAKTNECGYACGKLHMRAGMFHCLHGIAGHSRAALDFSFSHKVAATQNRSYFMLRPPCP